MKAKQKSVRRPSRGRNAAIVPPIGVDFGTALEALLKTPPPKQVARGKKRAAPKKAR